MGLAQQDFRSVCAALKMSTDAGRRDYFGSRWLQAQTEADSEEAPSGHPPGVDISELGRGSEAE